MSTKFNKNTFNLISSIVFILAGTWILLGDLGRMWVRQLALILIISGTTHLIGRIKPHWLRVVMYVLFVATVIMIICLILRDN